MFAETIALIVRAIGIPICFLAICRPLCSIVEFKISANILYRNISVIGNLELALLTSLGSDKNHTIRRTCTIDGLRGSILEDFHRLDVIGVDVVDTAHRHAVNDIQRSIVSGK